MVSSRKPFTTLSGPGLLDHFDITLEGVRHDTYLAAYLLDPTRTKYELADLPKTR